MKIGIIGAGNIGGTLARRLTAVGHEVSIANSRGPETLAALAKEKGTKAVTAREAARAGEVVIVTIPQKNIPRLPADLFEGVPDDVVVVDTNNYYPQQRTAGSTRSRRASPRAAGSPTGSAAGGEGVQQHLRPAPARAGQAEGRAAAHRAPRRGRRPASQGGRHPAGRGAGLRRSGRRPLDDSWRQQPATPVYCTDHDATGVRRALAEAKQERPSGFRASGGTPAPV